MGRRVDLNWDEWTPGLDTDDMTIAEVLATLPAANADEVPHIAEEYAVQIEVYREAVAALMPHGGTPRVGLHFTHPNVFVET